MKKLLILISGFYGMVISLQAQSGENRLSRITSPVAKLYLYGDQKLFPAMKDGRVWVAFQLTEGNCNAEEVLGGKTFTKYGDVYFTTANRTEFARIAAKNCVQFAEVFGRINSPRLLNDTARVHSFVNQVHEGIANGLPKNFKGKNVIVGIVDVGFQNDHPTFYNEDGTVYRVKRFWHQNNFSGTPPSGYNYGTEFTTASAIQAAVDNDGTHGTHVAGISSGSGFTTPGQKFRGMAPESDMVFVTIKYTNDTLQGSALGDYVVANPTIIDGYKYIFDYAAAQGKPAVTNLSWGMHTGPHDGTSVFDKAVETLCGTGKIIVGANGNDAGHLMHVSGNLNEDTAYTFAIDRNRNDYKRENVYCDFWGAVNEDLGINVSVFDTLGNLIMEEPFVYASSNQTINRTVVNGTDTLVYTMASQAKYANNNKPNILLIAETNKAGRLRIRIGITGKGIFHGWNSGQAYRWTSGSFLNQVRGNDYRGVYLNGLETGSMGENGGTGKKTISVGSYVNRNNWFDHAGVYRAQSWLRPGEISGFSSRGPTADGRMKPDVSAPGQLVASAVNRNQFAGWMDDMTLYKSQFKGETQYWTMFSGTSMAAPHAAGVIALMLEACPTLNEEQVRQILRVTSTKDALTGTDSNNNYGYGRINALEAVKAALEINRVSVHQSVALNGVFLFPNPADQQVFVVSQTLHDTKAQLVLSDVTGREVMKTDVHFNRQGVAQASTGLLKNGMYFYRLSTGNDEAKGRLLISR